MPEAHIRGDINTPYRCIGGAVFTMQRAGFARVGFISEPPAGQPPSRACNLGASRHGNANHRLEQDGEPMMEMNMTPLIDVLLVLLIMFIITIPSQTHAVKLDLPQNDPERRSAADRPGQEQDRDHPGGRDPVERRAGQPGAAAPVSRRDAADGPGARASPPARARSALRAGRRSAGGDQAGQVSPRWASSATKPI